jgi:hypothetical protein
MVWVAVGAVGGILAYRRAQELIADARERGVVLSVQQAGLSTVSALAAARTLAQGAAGAVEQLSGSTVATPGSAASRALANAKQGEQQ